MGEPLHDNKFFLPTIRNIITVHKKKQDYSKKNQVSYTYTVKANYLNKAVK